MGPDPHGKGSKERAVALDFLLYPMPPRKTEGCGGKSSDVPMAGENAKQQLAVSETCSSPQRNRGTIHSATHGMPVQPVVELDALRLALLLNGNKLLPPTTTRTNDNTDSSTETETVFDPT